MTMKVALAKESVGVQWGRPKWRIARLAGHGYGATCGYHTNCYNETKCQKTFKKQEYTNDECRVFMKQWLLAGLEIAEDHDEGQKTHLNMNPLDFEPKTEAEVDRQMSDTVTGLLLAK